MTQIHLRGIARFAWLNKPDTKFDSAGVYKTDLILSPEVAEPLIARFEKMREAAMADFQQEKKGKRAKEADLPIRPELDEDGNETGNYVAKVKMKASGVAKRTGKAWSRKLPLFDSVGSQTNARVGGGSDIICCVMPKAWSNAKGECSVTMYLEAVQVMRAAGGSAQDAGAFGFKAQEGGFVAPTDDEDTPPFDASDEDAGSDGDAAPSYNF